MKNAILLVIILFLLPALLCTENGFTKRGIDVRPKAPSGEVVTGNQWLFVVGIDTYFEWHRLRTAVSDARAVRDVLLSRYHFDKRHFIELYDEAATCKNIL